MENLELEKNKREINKEGFEDNAAVIIGTKKEVERQKERIETEGMAVDLATYIKLHKEIAVPEGTEIDRLWQKLAPDVQKPEKGVFTLIFRDNYGRQILYIDKEGNLARVGAKNLEVRGTLDTSELEKLGFIPANPKEGDAMRRVMVDYEELLSNEIKKQKAQDFDF